MRWVAALALLTGCPRPVPDHLRVQTQNDMRAAELNFDSREDLLEALVGIDPLVRAPSLPSPDRAREHDADIAAWIEEVKRLEAGDGNAGLLMDQIEERYPKHEVVALARGYRLRRAENRTGNLTGSESGELGTDLAQLLTPLRSTEATEGLTRSPMIFLGDDVSQGMRVYAERWVLAGWMVAPGLHTAPVTRALGSPQYDGLSESPLGRLLRNRETEASTEEGLALLTRATLLSLTRSAADRDTEQAAWAELKFDAREELHADEPEAALLQAAYDALAVGTRSDTNFVGGWVAATGLRWLDACADSPCGGLDRTEAFTHAARWGGPTRGLADVWRVIALKDAIDTMDAGHDTILFPTAIVQLADALLGTDAGPLHLSDLQKSRPDSGVWLDLSRAVGADGSTDWGETRSALGRHLEVVTDTALASNPDNDFTPLLQRIRKRAVR